ncbi:hypothetical protein F5J12DRAFT_781660 [Pisolithus orientalis]|uniref:uncharacterized protein n=1 Tax=Pisolithus orientalis TaxID=936130 RepID=UPI0022250E7B|nr:uncharacterized protein F5J12DRAFT_781660 [Pisolithus orientalis]KAI6012802.1 hypothetical protein F5J12DRAFT_781660 [Pisolithus orientalis]
MSANCAPCLSQLICAATPNPIEAEKAALKVKFVAASMALVTKAKSLIIFQGEVFPLVECSRELDIDMKIDVADGPVVAEADEAYEWWVAEEVMWLRVDKDVWMKEETSQGIEGQGVSAAVPVAMERMMHVEVPQLAHKAVAGGDDDDRPKISIPPGSVLHVVPCAQCTIKGMPCIGPSSKMCDRCTKMKQGCEKSSKGAGKRLQAGASTGAAQSTKVLKASPSKWAHDNDVEVVETHACGKGKAPMHGGVDEKTATGLSQALGLVRAEAMAAHVANLHLQVHVEQLAEALAKLGVE